MACFQFCENAHQDPSVLQRSQTPDKEQSLEILDCSDSADIWSDLLSEIWSDHLPYVAQCWESYPRDLLDLMSFELPPMEQKLVEEVIGFESKTFFWNVALEGSLVTFGFYVHLDAVQEIQNVRGSFPRAKLDHGFLGGI